MSSHGAQKMLKVNDDSIFIFSVLIKAISNQQHKCKSMKENLFASSFIPNVHEKGNNLANFYYASF